MNRLALERRQVWIYLAAILAGLLLGWETAVVVIVFQSLVELFGMVFYLWWLPRHLLRG